MAYTLRGRRVRYDNIAAGSATGRELTITGVSGVSEDPRNGELLLSVSGNATTDVDVERLRIGVSTSNVDAGEQVG